MQNLATALAQLVQKDTDEIVLRATARALAKLVQNSHLYDIDEDIKLGVREVLRLTEPRL